MAAIQDLSGTFSGSSGDNEDIPTNQADYLKVRAYLYKFTPEVTFAGSRSQQDFDQTYLDRTSAQDFINQANSLKPIIIGLSHDLQEMSFDQDYEAFSSDPKTIKVRGSLEAFLKLPTLASDKKLIIFDATRNDPTAKVNIKSIDISEKTYSGAISLKEAADSQLSQISNFTGVRNDLKKSVADLLTFLGSLTQTIDSIVVSMQGTQKKLQSDFTAVTVGLKQFQVSRFVYDLNTKDLSRFDISRYLNQYQVDQQLGMLCPGRIDASAILQNAIIPLTDLSPTPGPRAVRRPIFFPNKKGDYDGYVDGKRVPGSSLLSALGKVVDPESFEPVSTLEANELITRIAMAQTLEDNGGNEKTLGSSAYERDVLRLEIAMRLRGILDPRKKELIISFFRSGVVDDELVKRATTIKAPKSFGRNVATAELAAGNVTPLGLSSGFNAAERKIAKELVGIFPGNLKEQLTVLKTFLTDPKVDGLLVGDLIQKYDFLSIFVYKHEVSPDTIEEILEGATSDPFFFDKESLFMYTPSSYLLNQEDASDRHFATYSPEFNGFVLETGVASVSGSVNSLSLNLMGSMGLMGATKRIYNGTIFQDSVFDAAELSDERLFNLYQNLYQDKDPFQILTTLLEALYLLRVTLPEKDVRLTEQEKNDIAREIHARVDAAPSAVITQDRVNKIIADKVKIREAEVRKERTQGGKSDYIRDGSGNVSSFLDILSLRALNQFGETGKNGVIKGPKHLFNMASYLYANVMRSRRFNVRVATSSQVDNLDSKYGGRGAGTGKKPFALAKQQNGSFAVEGVFDPYISNKLGINLFLHDKESDGSGGSVLEVNPSISSPSTLKINSDQANKLVSESASHAWKSYFIFLSQSFGDFVADLKNGLEIMNDVINSCYLELYETPGGRFIYRTPQYNNNIPIYRTLSQDGKVKQQDTAHLIQEGGDVSYSNTTSAESGFAHMITSEDIIPISSEYQQSAKDLVTKQQMGYGADLIGVPIPQLYYFYSNGKAIAQYGLTMSQVVTNPNVRYIPREKLESLGVHITESAYAQGIFHYCRFFLEYNNLNKFEGTITAVGDPKIQVGRTYFDVANQKFGYITHVVKRLEVGGSYTTTFTLKAVRDAVYDEVIDSIETIGRPSFRKLPEMESFISRFANGIEVKTLSPTQKAKVPPTETPLPIQSPSFPRRIGIDGQPPAPLFIPIRSPFPVGVPRGAGPGLPGFFR